MLKIKCLKDLIVWQTKIWCVCLNLFLAAMAALYLPFVSDGVFGISRHGNNMCYVSLWSLDCETQIISEPPGLQQKKGCDIRVVKCTLAMFPVVPGTFLIFLKSRNTLEEDRGIFFDRRSWNRVNGIFSPSDSLLLLNAWFEHKSKKVDSVFPKVDKKIKSIFRIYDQNVSQIFHQWIFITFLEN